MFYLLLALPHILGLCALLWYAFAQASGGPNGEAADEGSDGGDGGQRRLPRAPRPVPPTGGLPLPQSGPPRRRLAAGERLSDLYPAIGRRDHRPDGPVPAPARRGGQHR